MKRLIALFLTLLFLSTAQPRSTISRSNPYFTKEEVYLIFTLRKQMWDDGSRITVFVMDRNNITHKEFVRNTLRMRDNRFRFIVNQNISLGAVSRYRLASSELDMMYKVSNTPNSIGYLSSSVIIINDGYGHHKMIDVIE